VVAWQNGLAHEAQVSIRSILAALEVIADLTQSEAVARAANESSNRPQLVETIVHQAASPPN
jgi:hypothetical protein